MAIFRATPLTVISAQTLTASAVYNTNALYVEGCSDAIIEFTYTTGAAETNNVLHIALRTESGQRSTTTGLDNENDYYDVVIGSASGGTISLAEADYQYTGAAAATAYKKAFAIQLQDKYLKIGVYETGVASNFGTVTVKVILVNKYQ